MECCFRVFRRLGVHVAKHVVVVAHIVQLVVVYRIIFKVPASRVQHILQHATAIQTGSEQIFETNLRDKSI